MLCQSALKEQEVSARCQWAGEVSIGHLTQEVTVCDMESTCVAVSNGGDPASNFQGFVSSLPSSEICDMLL